MKKCRNSKRLSLKFKRKTKKTKTKKDRLKRIILMDLHKTVTRNQPMARKTLQKLEMVRKN